MPMEKDSSTSILEEIEKRSARPIPRWHFLLKRFGFWLLAAFSVITGSIAMATAIYVFVDQDFIVDHDYISVFFIQEPLIANIVLSIPYLWLAALVLFMLVAIFGFRHTKKGYRSSTIKVIAGSLLASALLGAAFNTVDIGGYIHRYLIENLHGYNRLVYANENRWTQSEKGRLGGKVIRVDRERQILVLKDFANRIWLVDISRSEIYSGTPIAPGKTLKITGVKTARRSFQAISIQGWEKKYHRHSAPKKNSVNGEILKEK